MMISCSHSDTMRCLMVSWPTFVYNLMVKWPLGIIITKFFWLSICNQEKIWWSRGLLVNLTIFTHPTMIFSHGLMVKWPLYIIFTKFFRKSTWNQEKIDDLMFLQWDQEIPPVLLVNLTVFTHPTMRFVYGLMVKLWLWIIIDSNKVPGKSASEYTWL